MESLPAELLTSTGLVAATVVIHLIGVLLCVREPRFFDLWMTRVSRTPRVKNYKIWRCNSYRP